MPGHVDVETAVRGPRGSENGVLDEAVHLTSNLGQCPSLGRGPLYHQALEALKAHEAFITVSSCLVTQRNFAGGPCGAVLKGWVDLECISEERTTRPCRTQARLLTNNSNEFRGNARYMLLKICIREATLPSPLAFLSPIEET